MPLTLLNPGTVIGGASAGTVTVPIGPTSSLQVYDGIGGDVEQWWPGTTTTASISAGQGWTITPTQAHPAQASTSLLTAMNRATWQGAASPGTAAGIRGARDTRYRGDVAGRGGFLFHARVGIDVFVADQQIRIGLVPSSALAGEPSAVNNTIALVKDTADTAWFIASRDAATTTRTVTGATIAVNDVIDCWIYAPPAASVVYVYAVNLATGAVIANNTQITLTLPVNTVFMAPHVQVRAGASGTAPMISANSIWVRT